MKSAKAIFSAALIPSFVINFAAQTKKFYLRVKVSKNAMREFFFSTDDRNFQKVGDTFEAGEGRWIGAKADFFFMRPEKLNGAETADVDWFRFEKWVLIQTAKKS